MNDTTISRRVRALIARASHPGTPPPEADAARAMADKLSLRHGLLDVDPVQPAWEPRRAARQPTLIHWMSGFSPSGSKSRAWCRCGYGTTPRASEDRALRALVDDHSLHAAECVLCGVVYADNARWVDFRRFLQVLPDPLTGDEFSMCQDPIACRARIRT